nr:helix-turn-helix transcriptional regulator [Alicyclobacillus sendaiensis]
MRALRKREWLAKLRIERQLTHEQVAEMARIERSTYTKAELGHPVSLRTAKQIASVFGVSWVLFFEDDCPPGGQGEGKTA